jgi:hypothetical protein
MTTNVGNVYYGIGGLNIPPPLKKHRSGCLHHDRWSNFSPPTGIAAPLCPFNSGLKAGVSPCSTIALCPPVPPPGAASSHKGGASGVLIPSWKLVCPRHVSRHVSFRAFGVFRG